MLSRFVNLEDFKKCCQEIVTIPRELANSTGFFSKVDSVLFMLCRVLERQNEQIDLLSKEIDELKIKVMR